MDKYTHCYLIGAVFNLGPRLVLFALRKAPPSAASCCWYGHQGRERPQPRPGALAAGGALALIHLGCAPLLLPLRTLLIDQFEVLMERADPSIVRGNPGRAHDGCAAESADGLPARRSAFQARRSGGRSATSASR